MKKYIVEVESQAVTDTLRSLFEKVGKPQALHNIVIVQTDKPTESIKAIQGVLSVDEDCMAQREDAVNQPSPSGWGLPWISNTGGSYVNAKDGTGVDIYILDTGIRNTHQDFSGRFRSLYSFDGLEYDTSEGHGTNVAGCAAGTLYGTAKGATLVNCRTNFYNSDIIKALDVITVDHLSKPADRPSVLNFSGSSGMSVIGSAFEKVAKKGVVVVAAAGNYSEPQPRQPAANWWVEGVGGLNDQGGLAYFSNSGVSVYGPAQNVTTAGVASDGSSYVTSGTSFSCPYYAGLLACQLEGSSKFNTGALATNLAFYSRSIACDAPTDGRMQYFSQQGGPARSMSTRNQNGANPQYYLAPSLQYTDQEILDFVLLHESQPEVIAQSALDGNVDLARLVRVTGYTAKEINDYFIAHGVIPWWFVDGVPVY